MSRRGPGQALLSLLLLAGIAVVAARLYDEGLRPVEADPVPSPLATTDTAPAPAAAELSLALPPPEKFAVIAERPLFSPTRRPPPPEAAPTPEAELPPEAAPEAVAEPAPEPEAAPPPVIAFTLVGVVIDGSDRYALVERHADAKVVRLTEGGDIDGWFAVLIDPDRAVFRQGGVEEELVLKYDAPVSPERMPVLPQREVPETQVPQVEPGTVSGQPSVPAQTGPANPPAWKSPTE